MPCSSQFHLRHMYAQTTVQHSAAQWSIVQHAAIQCNVCTHEMPCSRQFHSRTYCATYIHTAHCNTVHHAATHDNAIAKCISFTHECIALHICMYTSVARCNAARYVYVHTYHTSTHCNTLQHQLQRITLHVFTYISDDDSLRTAAHCNAQHCIYLHMHQATTLSHTLQYTATHCNTLQHTATHTPTHIATYMHIHIRRRRPAALQHTTTHNVNMYVHACKTARRGAAHLRERWGAGVETHFQEIS